MVLDAALAAGLRFKKSHVNPFRIGGHLPMSLRFFIPYDLWNCNSGLSKKVFEHLKRGDGRGVVGGVACQEVPACRRQAETGKKVVRGFP